MSLCASCLALTPDTPGVAAHRALRIVDTQRRRIPGSVTVTLSTFRCSDCGAVWRYREAKDDGPQGWARVTNEAESEDR